MELSETQELQVEKTDSDVNQVKPKETNGQVATDSKPKIPHGQVTPNRSHAVVTAQTSDPVHREMRKLRWICSSQKSGFSPRNNLQCLRAKLVILLMFANQNPMAAVETSHESDEEYQYVYTVNYAESKKPPMCRVQIDGNVVEMMIDSGASVNLLDETTFQRIKKQWQQNVNVCSQQDLFIWICSPSTSARNFHCIHQIQQHQRYHPVTCREGKNWKPPQLQHCTEAWSDQGIC